MCIALTKPSAKAASIAFENRNVEKYYLALVHGHIDKSTMVIDIPIGIYCVVRFNTFLTLRKL